MFFFDSELFYVFEVFYENFYFFIFFMLIYFRNNSRMAAYHSYIIYNKCSCILFCILLNNPNTVNSYIS